MLVNNKVDGEGYVRTKCMDTAAGRDSVTVNTVAVI